MNTAQIAYENFLQNQLTENYEFDSMTSEEQNNEMKLYTKLKIEAQKEQIANQKEQETIEEQLIIDRELMLLNEIETAGYDLENTLENWQKLFSNKEIFGANNMNLASEMFSTKTFEDFKQYYLRYK